MKKIIGGYKISMESVISTTCTSLVVIITCIVMGIIVHETNNILLGIIIGIITGIIIIPISEYLFYHLHMKLLKHEIPKANNEINMSFPKDISGELYDNIDFEFQERILKFIDNEWNSLLEKTKREMNRECNAVKQKRKKELEILLNEELRQFHQK